MPRRMPRIPAVLLHREMAKFFPNLLPDAHTQLVPCVYVVCTIDNEKLGGVARHYVGRTVDLERRMDLHRKGQGAALLREMNRAGIAYEVVNVMPGSWALECYIKSMGHYETWCPRCRKQAGFDSVKVRPRRFVSTSEVHTTQPVMIDLHKAGLLPQLASA